MQVSSIQTFSLTILTLAIALVAMCSNACGQNQERPVEVLTASDVSRVIEDDQWVFVDTRPTDAFSGWKLEGIERGGHLPGAVDFPASWLDSDHSEKARLLSSALRVKGIEPKRHVVLYGTSKRDRDRVSRYLHNAGFRKLYDFDLRAWAADESLPLVRYTNFHLLVPPSVVKQILDSQVPETFAHAKRFRFVEVSWGGEEASYLKGHVPQSYHVNTDHFEPPPSWYLGDRDVLRRFAEKYGFQKDDTAILSSANPTASFRLAVVLRYIGVDDVRVLSGGFAAWKAAGYPVETTSVAPPKTSTFDAVLPQQPELILKTEQVKDRLRESPAFTLVDTRSWPEFIGRTSGYKYHSHKGRIPGSVYGQADFTGENSLTPYRNIDNTMRNAAEIQALWKQSGIDTQNHLSFLCGGGWRAAEVLTIAHVMGLENTSLYSDGWIGWSNDQTNAIDTGTPSK